MGTLSQADTGNADLYLQVENYPWITDEEFQGGLTAILGPNLHAEQVESLTLQARCFFYSRKFGIPIDAQRYRQWREEHHCPSLSHMNAAVRSDLNMDPSVEAVKPSPKPDMSPDDQTAEAAPYPSSFSHIVELITSGASIPGIKEIPDTVLEGQASEPSKSVRRKPWELTPTEDVDRKDL